jgi:hypothetical protein
MKIGISKILVCLMLLSSCQVIYDLNPKAYEEWLRSLPTDTPCQMEFYKKVDPKYYPACRSGYGDEAWMYGDEIDTIIIDTILWGPGTYYQIIEIDTVWIDTLKNK